MEIGTCIIGVFVYEDKKVVDFKLFEKDPKVIAEKMVNIDNNKEIEEVKEFKKKYKDAKVVNNPGFLKRNLREFAAKYNFTEDQSEFNKLVEGKIKQSEEVMNKATLLLEKGLQMTELETTLLEIKDLLEQITIQLSAVEQQAIEE